jgi:NADPH:quinone reductase-like Zn-dependent oxidoreductase
VVGVVGARHKVEAARALGADAVIDKSREALWRAAARHAPRGYDVVLDANGVATLGESYRALTSPGKLVVYGFHSMLPRRGGRPDYLKLALDWARTPRFDPLTMTNENKSVLAFNLSYLFERRDLLADGMRALLAWLEEGALAPLRVTEFLLEQVAEAHRALEARKTTGATILTL